MLNNIKRQVNYFSPGLNQESIDRSVRSLPFRLMMPFSCIRAVIRYVSKILVKVVLYNRYHDNHPFSLEIEIFEISELNKT